MSFLNSPKYKKLVSVLINGRAKNGPSISKISEEDVSETLKTLTKAGEQHPDFLIQAIGEALDNHIFAMVPTAIAVLLAKAPMEFLDKRISDNKLQAILWQLDCQELLEIIEILKTKYFGRGLGSKAQKLIRFVMEDWAYIELEKHIILEPKFFISLIKLIHPRYSDKKGALVRDFMASN